MRGVVVVVVVDGGGGVGTGGGVVVVVGVVVVDVVVVDGAGSPRTANVRADSFDAAVQLPAVVASATASNAARPPFRMRPKVPGTVAPPTRGTE